MLLVSSTTLTIPMPCFDWSTVPLYWYASDPWGEWNDTVLQYAASHAVVVPNGNHRRFLKSAQAAEEEKLHATARRLRHANSSTSVFFYLNSMIDWEQYDLHANILESWYSNVMLKYCYIWRLWQFEIRFVSAWTTAT